MHRIVCSLLLSLPALCCVGRGAEPDSIQVALPTLKDATAMVRVKSGETETTGTGFLVHCEGDTGYLLTNSHVIWKPGTGAPHGRIEVVLRSGTRTEQTLVAETVAADDDLDLAVVRVEAKGLPKPIQLAESGKLVETTRVTVLGFPFGKELSATSGNPEITVSQATVSSLRKDAKGRLWSIQLDGNLNPGNSGGPVVNAAGELVGVAVAKIDSAGIGFAVPGDQVRDFMRGDADRVVVTTGAGGGIKASLQLFDPLRRIGYVTMYAADSRKIKPPATDPKSDYLTIKWTAGADATCDGKTASAEIPAMKLQGISECFIQFGIHYHGSESHYTPTAKVSLKDGRVVGDQVIASMQPESRRRGREIPKQTADSGTSQNANTPGTKPTRLGLDANVEVMAPTADGTGLYFIRKAEGTPKMYRWDLVKNELAKEVNVPRSPVALALRGSEVVVACPESNVVVFVNSKTDQIVNAVECPKGMAPTDICPECPNGMIYVLCREPGWQDRTHVLVEIEPKTRRVKSFRSRDGQTVAVNGSHQAVQGNYAGSPSGIITLDQYPPPAQPVPEKPQPPSRDDLRFITCSPVQVSASGDFVCALGNITRAFTGANKTKWTVDGQLLAVWPGGRQFLLATGPSEKNWDTVNLCAVDDGGHRLWNTEVNPGATISGLITNQANMYARPRGFILGTMAVGNFLEAGMKLSPAAITRPIIVTSAGGDSLVYCVSAYEGTPRGSFAITLEETGRGWYIVPLPRNASGAAAFPQEITVGNTLTYTPPSGQGSTGAAYRLKQGPQGMTVDPKTGALQWKPDVTSLGQYDVEVVQDKNGQEKPVLKSTIRVRMP